MFVRPYSSFCSQYSLAVRLMLLLLLVNTFATACNSEGAYDERNDKPNERSRALAPDTASVRRRATAETATLPLLGNPFVASRSQSNSLSTYFDRINTNFTLDADAIENRHRPAVTDTIFTIRFGNSMMEFYAPSRTGELLLQVADIQSGAIKLRDNLRVGMPQAELISRLKANGRDMIITQTGNHIAASNQEGAPSTLHFHLKNGKVSRILYEGYVD